MEIISADIMLEKLTAAVKLLENKRVWAVLMKTAAFSLYLINIINHIYRHVFGGFFSGHLQNNIMLKKDFLSPLSLSRFVLFPCLCPSCVIQFLILLDSIPESYESIKKS